MGFNKKERLNIINQQIKNTIILVDTDLKLNSDSYDDSGMALDMIYQRLLDSEAIVADLIDQEKSFSNRKEFDTNNPRLQIKDWYLKSENCRLPKDYATYKIEINKESQKAIQFKLSKNDMIQNVWIPKSAIGNLEAMKGGK